MDDKPDLVRRRGSDWIGNHYLDRVGRATAGTPIPVTLLLRRLVGELGRIVAQTLVIMLVVWSAGALVGLFILGFRMVAGV